jgi:hypothetical protein
MFAFVSFLVFPEFFSSATSYQKINQTANTAQLETKPVSAIPPLDTLAYDKKLNVI